MKAKILRGGQEFVPQEKLGRNLFLTGLVSLVAATTVLLLFWLRLPPQVPTFYSRPWGQEQLGQPIFLFLPVALSTFFLILNALIAARISEDSFAKRALIIGGAAAGILAAITIIRIVLLII